MFSLLTIYIWLLTCEPGEALYARYGHTAIRVVDTEHTLDICFNYGTFSFDSDNFYWRFARGETYYMLDIEPTDLFLALYAEEGRKVYSQQLNMPQENLQALYRDLMRNSMPQNREYLYNFVYDNCSTRAYNIICKHLPDTFSSDYKGYEGVSYRLAIEHYTGKGAVMNSLINMVFGSSADLPMKSADRLFLPEELMNYFEQATYNDGTPVMMNTVVGECNVKQVKWWEKTWLYIVIFVIITLAVTLYDRSRNKLSSWFDVLVISLYLLLLVADVFIVFFSIHPLVGINWRLSVIPLVYLCTRLVYFIHR